MGFFLRRMVGDRADSLSHDQLLEVAEGALAMQEQLARDVLSLVEMTNMPPRTPKRISASCERARP